MTGLTARALRFYEDAGLLAPTDRTEGGFRLYNSGAVKRAKFIAALRGAGLPLNLINDILTVRSRHTVPGGAATEMTEKLQNLIGHLRAQVALLHQVKEDIAQTVEVLDTCRTCPLDFAEGRCEDCEFINSPIRPRLPASFEALWHVDVSPLEP